MESEEQIKINAEAFARLNKKRIAKDLTSIEKFPSVKEPVAVFMSGSPGAGKTETSLRLIEFFSSSRNGVLRIDSDDLRPLIPGYTGANSSLFQSATSIIADKMQDCAIAQHQSYIFDGTLTNDVRASDNVRRCLKHGFSVYIIYVYQDPVQAWSFVKARERKDGRVVPIEAFIDQYFKARECVNSLKVEFETMIEVHLIVKNLDGTDLKYEADILSIDTHVPETYTRDILRQMIQ
jgi:predicted ABC-type ATPase